MVRSVRLCPRYSALRPAFFGGHFSFQRNESTIAILRYEKILNYANVKRDMAMRIKRTPGIPPDVRPLNPQSKLF